MQKTNNSSKVSTKVLDRSKSAPLAWIMTNTDPGNRSMALRASNSAISFMESKNSNESDVNE